MKKTGAKASGMLRNTAVILSLLMLLSACGTHETDGTGKVTDSVTAVQSEKVTSGDETDIIKTAGTAETVEDSEPIEDTSTSETEAQGEVTQDEVTQDDATQDDEAQSDIPNEDETEKPTEDTAEPSITTGPSITTTPNTTKPESTTKPSITTTPNTTKPAETTKPQAHTHSYTSKVTKAATCGTDGVRTYTCKCGDSYTETIKATGKHSYTPKVTKAATCGTDGVRTYTCKCGDSYTETIKATGKHSYRDTKVEPKYYEQGYTQHDCTSCGKSYKDSFVENGCITKYRNLMKKNRYEAIKEYFEEDPWNSDDWAWSKDDGRDILHSIVFCNPIYTTKPFDIEAIKADMIAFGDYMGLKHAEVGYTYIDGVLQPFEITKENSTWICWHKIEEYKNDPTFCEREALQGILLSCNFYNYTNYHLYIEANDNNTYTIIYMH